MAKADQAQQDYVEFDPNAAPNSEATQGLDTEDGEGFSFDMSAEKASSGFPLIPNGVHNARIEAVEFKISQNSGNPMWQIKWAFTDEELAAKNRKITSFVVFSEDQRGRSKSFVKRVAPELAELKDFNPKRIAAEQTLVGKTARLKINTQKGQDDEDRSNVADVLAPAAGAGGGSFNL